MAASEHRTLLLLLALGVAGQGARLALGRAGEPPGQVSLLPVDRKVDPGRHRDSALATLAPLAPGERVDVDRAGVRELARLPRVGPALAKAIVANRDARGAFGSLEGLDRVSGIGPRLLEALGPHVEFSGTGRGSGEAGKALPAAQPDGCQLDPNLASVNDFDALPGIGPALAQRIVAYRESHGPFAEIDGLARVPGIGPVVLARIKPCLIVP
ncbi:MAG TPA: ComEA family DNA-binding protein [Gemmatimonadales bacterium]|nr:ComEA family DNA-binding protein [Gemmatimonadales bacterium]